MAKSQANLNPQQQAQLFELLRISGQQPTSGGMPIDAAQGQPGMGSLFSQQQAPQMQMQPGDKMDPQEAMRQILMSKASGGQLQQLKGGAEGMRVPVDQPLLRLFGMKRDTPIQYQNYADVAVQSGLVDFLPQGLAKDSKGNPIVEAETLERARQLSAQRKQNASDVPSREWGEALKSKVIQEFGPDNPRAQAILGAIDANGGVPLSRLSEISNALVTQPKDGDIYKGSDGVMYYRDRASGQAAPLPGGTSGVLSSFNPLELKLVQAEMKGFDNDAVVKDARKQVAQMTTISALVESRNPASLGVLAGNIAKGIGREAGALTNEDIARATGSQQLGDKWKRFWAKNVKGQLTDQDVSDFNALMFDINTAAQRQVKNVAANRSKRLGTILKRDAKELESVISFGTEFMPADEKPALEQPSPFTAARPGKATEGKTKSGVKYRVIP